MACILLHWSPRPLTFNCVSPGFAPLRSLTGSQSKQIQTESNLIFEICSRVEMKRKIELRLRYGQMSLYPPNWILCNAKLNQNTIFIVCYIIVFDGLSLLILLFQLHNCVEHEKIDNIPQCWCTVHETERVLIQPFYHYMMLGEETSYYHRRKRTFVHVEYF